VTKPAAAPPRRFAALAHRNYRLLWTGLIVSNVGTWMQLVSQSWLILEMTGRATDLGVLGLTRALPLIVLSLVGGTLADRLDKRRLLYLTQTLAALFAFLQGALTHLGLIQVWHIWALAFVSSAVLAFDQPTRQAMLPHLVPREDFMSAITLFAVTFNGASVLGPALAGLLVPVAGYAWAFYLNGISFAAVLGALALMRLPPPVARPGEPVWGQVREGIVYIWRHPTLRSLVEELNSERFVRFLSRLTGMEGLFADESLEGGGLQQSPAGGFLNIHADFTVHPHHQNWQRRVNVLVYLNKNWLDAYGGCLELWDKSMRRCVHKIVPLFNRAVIFNTDSDSFHGHPDPIRSPEGMTRKSIALYYFTKETKPLVRSTEYRPRPGEGLKGVWIYLDKMILRGYDFVKRRLGLSDDFASRLLNQLDRLKKRQKR